MKNINNTFNDNFEKLEKNLHVASSPHIADSSLTTNGMMKDVLIALLPVISMSIYVFQKYAIFQISICVFSCLCCEALFTKMRNKPYSLSDLSAVVTGIILALSLPWSAPWYVGMIASIVAIGIAKILFGGLGQNIFNPAMVGRAFVMICFPAILGASSYVFNLSPIDIITQATPLTAAKQLNQGITLISLFIGKTNGSLGETSALACLIGGIYLCVKRTASYEIPLSFILSIVFFAGIHNILNPTLSFTVLHHLLSGAILFGAFFIATDPVTNPLSIKGKYIFGIGLGFFVMIIRIFSGYPEGVMFAVLIMNALVPLINRVTVPLPIGGAVPVKNNK